MNAAFSPIAQILAQYGNQLLQPVGDVVPFPPNATPPGVNPMGPAAPIVGTIFPNMDPRLRNPNFNKYMTLLAQQGRR
jgi:hypothetical protein